MRPAKSRALILLSGGLDSTVALSRSLQTCSIELVLFFNYGQRALESERASVLAVVNYYGLPLREVDIRWLEALSPRGMRASSENDRDRSSLRELDEVWIPNRNGVFLNVAAAFAESYNCATVITGFNREEAVEFPDNSSEYVDRVNESLKYSTRSGVQVVSPTLGLTKREIILEGVEAGAPLSVIWSCYREAVVMCGVCGSCERLRVALAAVPEDKRPVIEFSS